MTYEAPLWLRGPSGVPIQHTPRLDRRLVYAAFTKGVLLGHNANALRVQQRSGGSPAMSVDVAAGMAVIEGTEIANQNSYLVSNSATKNIVIDAAPGSGTRQDRVYARVRDSQAAGANDDWFIGVVTGSVGGGLPSLPASSIDLGRVNVSAGQVEVTSSHIVDLRPQSVPLPHGMQHGQSGIDPIPQTWEEIAKGSGTYSSASQLSIPIPGGLQGVYTEFQLRLRGVASEVMELIGRMNNITAADAYMAGLRITGHAENVSYEGGSHSGMLIGQWATFNGNLMIINYHVGNAPGAPSLVSYYADGMRHSSTPSAHQRSESHGRINQSILLQSLQIRPRSSPGSFTTDWILRGIR